MEEAVRSTPHPGSCRQGPGASALGCTTNGHKTHKTECATVHYPWHPLFAQKVIIQRRRLRRGCPTAACVPENNPQRASLEIPEWMLDEARCSQMRIKTKPWVCWMALAELSSLLQQAGCGSDCFEVKYQHRFFTDQGGADANQRPIPTAGAAEPVSSSPQTAPMESSAERSPAKRHLHDCADAGRTLRPGPLYCQTGGGNR